MVYTHNFLSIASVITQTLSSLAKVTTDHDNHLCIILCCEFIRFVPSVERSQLIQEKNCVKIVTFILKYLYFRSGYNDYEVHIFIVYISYLCM